MGDVFAGLLPYLPGLPFSVLFVIVFRLWNSAVKELRIERADHRLTQGELDAERDARRAVEDKMDDLSREVKAGRAEFRAQTAEITRLTAEVSRLRAAVGELT